MFDFSSQPRWPTWRWLLHELKYYVATGAIVGVGFVVVSAVIYGSGLARLIVLAVVFSAVSLAIAPSLARSRGLEVSYRAKILLLDVGDFATERLWGPWKPTLPGTVAFPRSIGSPASWTLSAVRA